MDRRLSIITPFFNEGRGVEIFSREIDRIVDDLAGYDVEIVWIDDGSTDDTLSHLLAISAGKPRHTVVELSTNFGKEAALTAGLDVASGDAVIPIDADLQDPPDLIPAMVAAWEAGAEVVLAKRSSRASDSAVKRKTAQWFYRVHNQLSRTKIPENVGDFRLMDRTVVDAVKRLPERQRFMKGLFAWVGYRTVTIEYVRPPRHAGKTKFSGWKLWNLALEGLTGFSTAPLRVWTYIGLLGAAVAMCFALYILVRTLLFGIDTPGYASLLIAIVLFGSLQLVSIGIIGEYVGRIYTETKQRPNYLVRRIHRGAA
ncbi:glycosyltransferase family 2 protein [Aureimonas mangrovi]|uniref:glycosyltransferase family 2 protein n=1 Tax=Aureimonas mangrovi TaxID=2758041 RepID=UPI00163D8765|nr:glycosyltransferase family 2 protein [Aureimonas mangrovi]